MSAAAVAETESFKIDAACIAAAGTENRHDKAKIAFDLVAKMREHKFRVVLEDPTLCELASQLFIYAIAALEPEDFKEMTRAWTTKKTEFGTIREVVYDLFDRLPHPLVYNPFHSKQLPTARAAMLLQNWTKARAFSLAPSVKIAVLSHALVATLNGKLLNYLDVPAG